MKGTYNVAGFGDDMSGRCPVTLEDSEAGVSVKEIDAALVDVVSGQLKVGDRIAGVWDSRLDTWTDVRSTTFAQTDGLFPGPYGSKVRLSVVDEKDDRRVVELRRNIENNPRAIHLCFSRDGKTIAIADRNMGHASINLETGETKRYPHAGTSVAISPDSRLLAMDGTTKVAVWDLGMDEQHVLLDGKVNVDPMPRLCRGGSLVFSHDGKFLAIGTGFPFNHIPKRSDLKVWRVDDWSEIGAPLFQSDRVLSALTFTPDNAYLLAADHSGIIRLWNTMTWELEDRTFDVGTHAIKVSITISDDGRLMATSTPGPGNNVVGFSNGRKAAGDVGG